MECIIQKLNIDSEKIISELYEDIEKIKENTGEQLKKCNIEEKIKKIESKKQAILDLFLDGSISKEEMDYAKSKYAQDYNSLKVQLAELDKQQEIVDSQIAKFQQTEQILLDIMNQRYYASEVYAEILEKIVVYSEQMIDAKLIGVPGWFRVYYSTARKQNRYKVEIDQCEIISV